MKLVLASNNAGKLRELQALFTGLPVELIHQGALGVSEADEPHPTFLENALAKARHASAASGLPAIADDSGLCVAALAGLPGVDSAVYAGPVPPQAGEDREAHRRRQDAANNHKLLQALEQHSSSLGAESEQRRARFVCTLVAIRHAQDPEPLVAFGRWEGVLLRTPQGQGGFGYDPLMFIPELQASVAELSPQLKNQHSHRALAAAQLRQLMVQAWGLQTA